LAGKKRPQTRSKKEARRKGKIISGEKKGNQKYVLREKTISKTKKTKDSRE